MALFTLFFQFPTHPRHRECFVVVKPESMPSPTPQYVWVPLLGVGVRGDYLFSPHLIYMICFFRYIFLFTWYILRDVYILYHIFSRVLSSLLFCADSCHYFSLAFRSSPHVFDMPRSISLSFSRFPFWTRSLCLPCHVSIPRVSNHYSTWFLLPLFLSVCLGRCR